MPGGGFPAIAAPPGEDPNLAPCCPGGLLAGMPSGLQVSLELLFAAAVAVATPCLLAAAVAPAAVQKLHLAVVALAGHLAAVSTFSLFVSIKFQNFQCCSPERGQMYALTCSLFSAVAMALILYFVRRTFEVFFLYTRCHVVVRFIRLKLKCKTITHTSQSRIALFRIKSETYCKQANDANGNKC